MNGVRVTDILLVEDRNNRGYSIGDNYDEVLQNFIATYDYDFMNDMTAGETKAWHFRIEHDGTSIKRVYLGYKLNEDDTLISDDYYIMGEYINPIIDIINSEDDSLKLNPLQRFILPHELDDIEFIQGDIRVQLLKDDCDYSYFEAYLITSDELDDDVDSESDSDEFLDGYDEGEEYIADDDFDDDDY